MPRQLTDSEIRARVEAIRKLARDGRITADELVPIFGAKNARSAEVLYYNLADEFDLPGLVTKMEMRYHRYRAELQRYADARGYLIPDDIKTVTRNNRWKRSVGVFKRYGIELPEIREEWRTIKNVVRTEIECNPADDIRRDMRAADLYPSGLPVFDSPTERDGQLWYMVR